MKNLTTLLFLFLFSLQSFTQTIAGATAEIHLDSTTQESISGLFPISGNMEYVEDHLGNSNAAGTGSLDFGDPDFARMGTSDFSIAFWFKRYGSLWPVSPIIKKQHAVIDDYQQYFIRYNGFFSAIDVNFKPSSDSASLVVGKSSLPISVWMHIVVTFDRDNFMKFYIDTELVDEEYIGHLDSIPANVDDANLIIGQGNMSLDEIIFFKKALDSTEVEALYNGQLTSLKKPITKEIQNLNIFPNPNNGRFNITFPKSVSSEISVSVFNNLGQQVFEKNKIQPANNLEIDLPDLSEGIYFVLLKTEEGVFFNGKIQVAFTR